MQMHAPVVVTCSYMYHAHLFPEKFHPRTVYWGGCSKDHPLILLNGYVPYAHCLILESRSTVLHVLNQELAIQVEHLTKVLFQQELRAKWPRNLCLKRGS